MTGFTIGLFLTAIVIPLISFPYAETTKDPDLIAGVAWFIAIGVLLLAIVFAFVTVGTWLHIINRRKMPVTILDSQFESDKSQF